MYINTQKWRKLENALVLVEAVLDRLALRFFLERAGELRINILRKRKGGKEPPGQKKRA